MKEEGIPGYLKKGQKIDEKKWLSIDWERGGIREGMYCGKRIGNAECVDMKRKHGSMYRKSVKDGEQKGSGRR